MTTLRNVTLASALVRRCPAAEVDWEGRDLLARVVLSQKRGAYPDELSGGQQ